MPRARRGRATTVAAAAALPALAVLQVAHAALPARTFGPGIEALAAYDGQDTCSPTAKAGATALRSLLVSSYAGTGDLGIVRDCATGGTSEHKEGRAFDWKVNAFNASQDAAAKNFFAAALATDQYGNKYAIARRLGIMYMIYNKSIWSAYNADAGWRPYTGANPHTDHVHISLSRVGGDKGTSYWTGTPARTYTATSKAVLDKWESLGGAEGVLGAPVQGEYAVAGGRAQDFKGGTIYYSTAQGATAVYGAIGVRYTSLGGTTSVLGMPVGDEVDVPGVPGARMNRFTNGRIYWSPKTGVGSVQGAIATRHAELGGPAGALGLPVDDEKAAGKGRVSTFSGGRIVWGANSGAHAVVGAIGVGWDRVGGAAGPLGLPTSSEQPAAGGARTNSFENGDVYWSAKTGVAAVQGAIAGRYEALGGPAGALGLPLEDEKAAGKGRVSRFQGGRLVWGPTTETHLVAGAVGVGWDQLGGAAGPLGLPSTDEVAAPGGGRMNAFQGGGVYWSAQTGVNGIYGAIAAKYAELGGAAALGIPVANEVAVKGGRMSQLKLGRIYYGGTTGAHLVAGAIGVGYDRAGGPNGVLGLPTSDEVAAGRTGRASSFQGGRVLWSPATGVHAVTGPALAHYDANGGANGFLGFPTSGLTRLDATASYQDFQGGRVYVVGGRAQSVRGAILATYLHLGGSYGSLGLPTSDEYDVPGGRRSDFTGGSLVFDSRTGAITRL